MKIGDKVIFDLHGIKITGFIKTIETDCAKIRFKGLTITIPINQIEKKNNWLVNFFKKIPIFVKKRKRVFFE